MRVLVTQSNYVPWRGYFAAIRSADIFVIYDTVQYTTRDWRNRNRIIHEGAPAWLSIPVSGDRTLLINQVEISDTNWINSHCSKIRNAYPGAKGTRELDITLSLLESTRGMHILSEINQTLLQRVCDLLEISTPIVRAEDFSHAGNASERLASIAQQSGATTYLTGPAANSYLDEKPFIEKGIAVEYVNYGMLPALPANKQTPMPVSILHDLLTFTHEDLSAFSTFSKDASE